MTIKFTLSQDNITTTTTDCIILGIFTDDPLCFSAQTIDNVSGGKLSALIATNDLSSEPGKTTMLHALPGITAPRVLLVGMGKSSKELSAGQYLKSIKTAIQSIKTGPIRSALLTLSEIPVAERNNAWNIRHAIIAADHSCYRYTETLGTENSKRKTKELKQLTVIGNDSTALEHGKAIASGVRFARALSDLPPNICHPTHIAQQAQSFAKQTGKATCEVLERNDMEALGMGSLLAVAQGSANPPKLVVLKYNNAGNNAPYVLVGKGVTFDSGGINLKTQGGIEEMKYDMCGAATVIGTFVAAVTMQLPINLVVIAAAVENMPDGNAYRPSDVITSMSGKTIEVGNTDAEGRLILCDALTYAQKFNPCALIDVATLTGACMVALGSHATGLMSHHDDLCTELLDAGEYSVDRAWRLPLWKEYQSMLDSNFADVYNIGGRWAGAITAGCFLSHFTENQRWAHLDIAGSASNDGKMGMATGRPVGLLSQWLMDRCA